MSRVAFHAAARTQKSSIERVVRLLAHCVVPCHLSSLMILALLLLKLEETHIKTHISLPPYPFLVEVVWFISPSYSAGGTERNGKKQIVSPKMYSRCKEKKEDEEEEEG